MRKRELDKLEQARQDEKIELYKRFESEEFKNALTKFINRKSKSKLWFIFCVINRLKALQNHFFYISKVFEAIEFKVTILPQLFFSISTTSHADESFRQIF